MAMRVAIVVLTVAVALSAREGVAEPLATVPFDICAQSATWQRPSASVQSKVWNDPRYAGIAAAQAYEWTHSLFWSEPDSASLAYDHMRLSGLWTEFAHPECQPRGTKGSQWVEIWSLNHLISTITTDGVVHTITVVPQERGYELIQFRRPADSKVRVRFVSGDGTILTEWIETAQHTFADSHGAVGDAAVK